jgi:hypothetical protein
MSAKLFPPFNQIVPLHLARALESLSSYAPKTVELSSNRWKRMIEKLGLSEPLTGSEKVQIMCNIGSVPPNLLDSFVRLFMLNLNENVLNRCSLSPANRLEPTAALQILKEKTLVSLFGQAHLPLGVFEASNGLGSPEAEASWLTEALKQSPNLKAFLQKFAPIDSGPTMSAGQRRLARGLIESTGLPPILDRQFETIQAWLFELNTEPGLALFLVNELLGNYFGSDPTWSTKVLEPNYFLHKILIQLPKLSVGHAPALGKNRNVELLKEKFQEISNALKLLNEAEPDRGTFWKQYISRCHAIVPKKIDHWVVGTAFIFPTFVIVDYGPKGSAALLYDREIFEKNVMRTPRWRDLAFVKKFPPYTNDGRLEHHSGWQRKFNELIVLLLRAEGDLPQ